MARGDLTDHEWAMIGPLLLPECGRWAEQGVVGCPAANLGRPQPDR